MFTVTFGRTKSQNYQSKRSELTLHVEDAKLIPVANDVARAFVNYELGDKTGFTVRQLNAKTKKVLGIKWNDLVNEEPLEDKEV